MVAHIAITRLRRQRQEDYLKFMVSLAYAASQGCLKQKTETKPEGGGGTQRSATGSRFRLSRPEYVRSPFQQCVFLCGT